MKIYDTAIEKIDAVFILVLSHSLFGIFEGGGGKYISRKKRKKTIEEKQDGVRGNKIRITNDDDATIQDTEKDNARDQYDNNSNINNRTETQRKKGKKINNNTHNRNPRKFVEIYSLPSFPFHVF